MIHSRFLCRCAMLFMVVTMVNSGFAYGQRFIAQGRVEISGEVRAVNGDELTLADPESNIGVYKIQRKNQRGITIDGGFLNAPATIKAIGKFKAVDFLQRDMVVKFTASLRKGGRSDGEVSDVTLIRSEDLAADAGADAATDTPGSITEIAPPQDSKYAQCEVVGIVKQVGKGKLSVMVGKSSYASKGRVRIDLADDAVVGVERDDLNLVQPGDVVSLLNAIKLNTGDYVVDAIAVEMTGQRSDAIMDWFQQEMRYGLLSDAPSAVRDVRSRHFLLHTDVSDREGQRILDKLETMIDLVSKYYRRPSRGLIECYVVRDIENWSTDIFPEGAIAKIKEPAGVTMTRSLGKQRRTIVFSCDNPQTVQHEAIHAYCQQTFGSTGPVWYSEGMAEMGAYWKEGQLEVDIQPGVIRYLTKATPKKMLDIVAAGQVTGDSWQAYAWRWALCHLLANNPNYSARLKGLGVAMMSGQKASFEATYGDVAEHISFEYDQFVQNFGNGYRADLAAWQWDVKAKRMSKKPVTETVDAKRGWQSTSVLVEQGKSYRITSTGTWQITAAGAELTADGNDDGDGKLIGAVFSDFKLSSPFELGTDVTWVATEDGQLVLRCRDPWTELSENEGQLEVSIQEDSTP